MKTHLAEVLLLLQEAIGVDSMENTAFTFSLFLHVQ
jgi:hypothetical protein